jgi:hypothetical protein
MAKHVSPYETCVEVCGRLDRPGMALETTRWMNYVGRETTADQARIEAVMAQMDLLGRNILHVGIGNSRLAQRFAQQAQLIDGITVSEQEKAFADSLAIPGYSTYVLNKYSRDVLSTLRNRYDVIIDNNLSSFACCKYHFYSMLDSYSALLKPGGRILTDLQGMEWVTGELAWRLSFEDLLGLAEKFPLSATVAAEKVYAIQRTT